MDGFGTYVCAVRLEIFRASHVNKIIEIELCAEFMFVCLFVTLCNMLLGFLFSLSRNSKKKYVGTKENNHLSNSFVTKHQV